MRWAVVHTVNAPGKKVRTVKLVIDRVPDGTGEAAVRAALDDAGMSPDSAGIAWGNHVLKKENASGTWPLGAAEPPDGAEHVGWDVLSDPPGRDLTTRKIPAGQYAEAGRQAGAAGISVTEWARRAWAFYVTWGRVDASLRALAEDADHPDAVLTAALKLYGQAAAPAKAPAAAGSSPAARTTARRRGAKASRTAGGGGRETS